MGFNPPVPQQDNNWEIRAAVLLSLFFQVLLIFLGPTRKRSSAPLFRLTVWSCYLLADWVADLALGLLLNNMGNIGGNNDNNAAGGSCRSSSPVIFAFWTPFLLLHLGGPDTITAYSVEDNELWNRHLIGLLFELFSACIIIFCSLQGNPLVPATMLMLVAGVIKYGERTYSLYYGSVEGFRNLILDDPDPGPNYAKLMTEFDSKEKAGLVVEIAIADGEASKAQKEMEKRETNWLVLDEKKSVEARAYEFFLIFRHLLFDFILGFRERRLSQAFFLRETEEETPRNSSSVDPDDEKDFVRQAFEVIEVELNFMYDMVYTKAPVAHSTAGWVLRCICSGCLVSALAVFFFLDKPGHQIQGIDVGITYALLLGGMALDAAALLMLFFSNRTKVHLETTKSRRLRWLECLRRVTERWQTRRRWSATVSQMNLIRYCLQKLGPYSSNKRGGKWWLMIVKMLGIEDIVDDFFFIRRVRLEKGEGEEHFFLHKLVPKCCRNSHRVKETLLFEFIFNGLKDAVHKLKKELDGAGTTTQKEDNKVEDALLEKVAISEVCKRRGDGVIRSHEDDIKWKRLQTKETTTTTELGHGGEDRFKMILDSMVKSDFDESLLLWHIATDLCMYRDYQGPMDKEPSQMHAIGECLSEYMLYLLIKQPDMLAATAGIGLIRFRDTSAEARRFFDSMAAWIDGHDDLRRMLLSVNTTQKPAAVKGDRSKSVLFDGVILAKKLRELDEEVMWDVITGVWLEMLTYAAAKCPGSMHVRQLSRGGELITLVYFLMAHMGLGDVYQIEGDAKAKLIVNDQ